jgi:hypothetical protein
VERPRPSKTAKDGAPSGVVIQRKAGPPVQLQHRQDVMDAHAADMHDQRGHYMAVPGQDPQIARNNADKFIQDHIDVASQGVDASGKYSSAALDALGDAMHTLQDMTSPMHTTADGTPKTWEGYGVLWHKGAGHWAGENDPSNSWARFGWAIRLTLASYVQTNPVDAAKHGLTANNYEKEANQRISEFIGSYFIVKGDPIAEGAAKQCAMGNPAACD